MGSTKALHDFAISSPQKRFIVVTESGILHEMQKACPDKEFIPVPPEATETIGCHCNECEYMRLNTLEKLLACLQTEQPEIIVEPSLAEKALLPIERMLRMS